MSLTQINKAGLDEIALDHVFTIGASGSSAYTFQGEGLNGTVNNPTLYLTRGKTYRFENGSGGHPIRIQSTSGASGTAYNTGVTNNAGSGTVIVEVQHDAPDVLYYQCTSHAAMNGILYITGALADGGVTTAKIADDAVNNDKLANSVVASIAANTAKTSNATHTGDVTGSTSLTIANNAVTTDKIADDAIRTRHYGDNSIDTAFIADNAVTHAKYQDIPTSRLLGRTSSGTGDVETLDDSTVRAFLGVSAGANQTTINSNADDRVITGSGTANTLNGESNMTYTSNTLKLQDAANDTSLLHIVGQGTATRGLKIGTSQATGASQNDGAAVYDAIDSESNAYGAQHRFKIAGEDSVTIGYNGAKGYVGINDTVPYPDSIGGNTVDTCLELGGSMTGSDKASVIKLNGRASGSSNKCQIQWCGANNRFDITVNGNQALQIQANKDVEVTDGNLVIGTSGHGIDFSATSNGSGGSNVSELFDDYETGTFTPQIVSGVNVSSYTHQRGSYTKIGNMVFLQIDMTATGSATSNAIEIGNFPFNSRNQTYYAFGGAFIAYANDTFPESPLIHFHVLSQNNRIRGYNSDGGVLYGNGTGVRMHQARECLLVVSYQAG